MSKTYVFTDVHGRLEELLRLLDRVPKGAKLIFLGDYIDRGTQSAEVVALVRSLDAICLRGNHEDMMCNPDTMGGTWMANGGSATVESYKDPLTGEINAGLMEEHAAWFESLPESEQQQMMGQEKHGAYKDGKFEFSQLSAQFSNEVYGHMRSEASLASLIGEE